MSTTSILQRTRNECFFVEHRMWHVCQQCQNKACMGRLEDHHLPGGTANRKKADKYGLVIRVPREIHAWLHDTGAGQQTMYELKRYAQHEFEKKYGEEMWMETFHKNYL